MLTPFKEGASVILLVVWRNYIETSYPLYMYSFKMDIKFGTLILIDKNNIQHWKMQEIWHPFHRSNHLISKGFSIFERTSSKSYPFFKCSSGLHNKIEQFFAWNGRERDFVFLGNFDVVWSLLNHLNDIYCTLDKSASIYFHNLAYFLRKS